MSRADRDATVLRWARHVIAKSMLGARAEGEGIIVVLIALARYLLRRSVVGGLQMQAATARWPTKISVPCASETSIAHSAPSADPAPCQLRARPALRRLSPVILALMRALFKDLETAEALRRFLYLMNTVAWREGTGLKFLQPLTPAELQQRALTYHTSFALVMVYSQDWRRRRSPCPAHTLLAPHTSAHAPHRAVVSVSPRRAQHPQVPSRCRAFARRILGGVDQKRLNALPYDGWPSEHVVGARTSELRVSLQGQRRRFVSCYKGKCASLRDNLYACRPALRPPRCASLPATHGFWRWQPHARRAASCRVPQLLVAKNLRDACGVNPVPRAAFALLVDPVADREPQAAGAQT